MEIELEIRRGQFKKFGLPDGPLCSIAQRLQQNNFTLVELARCANRKIKDLENLFATAACKDYDLKVLEQAVDCLSYHYRHNNETAIAYYQGAI